MTSGRPNFQPLELYQRREATTHEDIWTAVKVDMPQTRARPPISAGQHLQASCSSKRTCLSQTVKCLSVSDISKSSDDMFHTESGLVKSSIIERDCRGNGGYDKFSPRHDTLDNLFPHLSLDNVVLQECLVTMSSGQNRHERKLSSRFDIVART